MTLQPRHRPALVAALLAVAIAVPLNARQAQKRSIAEKDLFKFVWVADPQISPDGTQVAFVRVAIDEKKDAYETSIWIAKTDGSEAPRAFTSGVRDTSPRWAPDGRRLAFVRTIDFAGDDLALDLNPTRVIERWDEGDDLPWQIRGFLVRLVRNARVPRPL